MPFKPLQPCAEPGCGRLVSSGRCQWHVRPKPVRPARSGSAWRALRAQVLAEEPRCRVCGQPSTDVDHIIARVKGGTDARANLQALCHRHHSQKTANEVGWSGRH